MKPTVRLMGLVGGFACVMSAIGAADWDPLASTVTPVRAQRFLIDYDVPDEAMPLLAVRLWYVRGDGQAWHLYGEDPDRRSPIEFHAPAEGDFAFLIVLENETGSSFDGTPGPGTVPHQRVCVDFTPPVVQLHPVQVEHAETGPAAKIRWTLIDGLLPTRPVRLYYRTSAEEGWLPVVREPFPNTGRFDWRLPTDMQGPFDLRITAEDRGGNIAKAERSGIEIPIQDTAASQHDLNAQRNELSPLARERLERNLADAQEASTDGRLRQALALLRDVVRADPANAEALSRMGEVLLHLNEPDRAKAAFELALSNNPLQRSALRGAARIDRMEHNYGSAAGRLRAILEHNPEDIEVWLNLGDVAIFQGDEIAAREYYLRAISIDPESAIAQSARERVELMDDIRGARVAAKQ